VPRFEISSSDLASDINDVRPSAKSHRRKNDFRRAEIAMSSDEGDFSSP